MKPRRKSANRWKGLFAITAINWMASIALPTYLGIKADCMEGQEIILETQNGLIWNFCNEYKSIPTFDLILLLWRGSAIVSWIAPLVIYLDMKPKEKQMKLDKYLNGKR